MHQVADEQLGLDHPSLFLCLKALASPPVSLEQYGLRAVMDNKESVRSMVCSLRSPKVKTVTMAVEMLSAVCFIPDGHERIMEGPFPPHACTRPSFAVTPSKYRLEVEGSFNDQSELTSLVFVCFFSTGVSHHPDHVKEEVWSCGQFSRLGRRQLHPTGFS